MHFKTPRINLDILPVERFLEVLAGWPVDRPGTTRLEVTRESLPERGRHHFPRFLS